MMGVRATSPGTAADDVLPRLFDEAAFEQTLEQSASPLEPFRDALRQGDERLGKLFDEGWPVAELVAGRARFMDAILRHAWRLNLPADADAALVAVGGYGRGELHPASDVDLMILLGDGDARTLHDPIERLLMLFWDIGLEVGHSVRTVADCVREAEKDITVVTNIMESRLLAGDRPLYERMVEATGPEHIWPGRAFFEAKYAEQRQRYARYDDTYSNLEPNIKGSPGGLRDIQMVGWVTKRHFGNGRLHYLLESGFLTEGEYKTLVEGRAFLWKIRFALHLLNRRREDRLLFENQRVLAERFGYHDQAHALGVELFMQDYYRTVMELSRLNEMLLQLFQEIILLDPPEPAPVPINRRFQSRAGFIEAADENVFRRSPAALLEIFLLLELHPELKGVRASTIRMIRCHRHLIDDRFRHDLGARTLFMEILRQPSGITHVLRRMNRYGVLAAYIPAFANIVGRMQYDLFHVYTVDEHTLFVVRNLRRFTVPEHADEFPLCSRISNTLPKPELLYLAGLFHDIAKGRGGDHSTLGANDAHAFCRLHHLSEYDSALVAWLVKNHLVMSMTAQRKDISDPDVVQAFAETVGDPVRLDYLYLLTVADIRATDPKRWNSWKDALLRELYTATRKALVGHPDDAQAREELVQGKQNEARRLLAEKGIDEEQFLRLWGKLSLDYFLHNSPENIAWHTATIVQTTEDHLPLIAVRRLTERGASEVLFYGHDRDRLFAVTTSVLDGLGFNILDARIITTDEDKALNSYTLLEQDGRPITSARREEEVIETLRNRLTATDDMELRVSRRLPRRYKPFARPTEIRFSEDPSRRHTIMQLAAQDRPGLLAEVGYAFASCGVRLQQAKIATIGAEVEDIFFLTDRDNQPLHDPERQACLREIITERLSASGKAD